MSHLGHALSYSFSALRKAGDQRTTVRRKIGAEGWIRIGFAVRPCRIVDLSETGVRIRIASVASVPRTFALLTSRNAGAGRTAEVKWRRGMEIGAKFV